MSLINNDERIQNSQKILQNGHGSDVLITSMDKLHVKQTIGNQTMKRKDFLGWHEYFMAMAFLAAKRSKDPVTQVGAVVVSQDKKIVGIGYNGMPAGCSDDEFPWGKEAASPYDNKYLYVCHAEMNAILNKNIQSVKGCVLYVVLFPCNECAKIIIQSEISQIYYMSDKNAEKNEYKASKRMLDAAKIVYIKFQPKHRQLVIDFDSIETQVQL